MSHYICMICSEPSDIQEEDTRNIIDVYKHCHVDCIKEVLEQDRSEMVAVAQNIAGDFNLATMLRNFNAFSGSKFYIAGRKKWDRRGAVGVNHYEHIVHVPSTTEAINALRHEGYFIVAVDNVDGYEEKSFDLDDISKWSSKTAFVFGEEQLGLDEKTLDSADMVVYIGMSGSVRSLNVGTTSGIIFNDYRNKVINEKPKAKGLSPMWAGLVAALPDGRV